jgi:hypothetical protein
MNNKDLSFKQSLQYKLAEACKENNLPFFKELLFSQKYSHYDRKQLSNTAFLAAYMDSNESFIRYLILDYRIEKTELVNRFLSEDMLKLFNLRSIVIELESLAVNQKNNILEKI